MSVTTKQLEREREALDAIENVMEYALGDIHNIDFVDFAEDVQAAIIEYRSKVIDLHQTMMNTAKAEEAPAGFEQRSIITQDALYEMSAAQSYSEHEEDV